MAVPPASRQPKAPNLADVLAAIEKGDLTASRRRDLRSAIVTLAKGMGRHPAEISADPASLRKRLGELTAEGLGISQGRLANIRSLLLRGLALIKPMLTGRQTIAITPDWQVLLDQVENLSARIKLSPVIRWLCDKGIGPAQVTEADLLRYQSELMDSSLRLDPAGTWQGFAWQWNKASREIPGFPTFAITLTSRKPDINHPWSYFPSILQTEADAWGEWLRGDDILADGPVKPVKTSTVETRNYQIRSFASAIADSGIDPATLKSLADLVALPNFEAGLRHLYQRKGSKRSSTLGGIGGAMISIARHWVLPKLDDEHAAEAILKRMRFLVSRVDVQARGLTDKNHQRLMQLEDPQQLQKLLNLPERLKREVLSGNHPKAQSLVLADMAVAIELLIITGVRIGNLRTTLIDVNLRKYRNRFILTYASHEVKNEERLQFELPDSTCSLLNWYLKDIRPQRLKGISDALFIGEDGLSPKGKSTFGVQITQTVKHYTGLKMNPHLFRHAMAYVYLNANPGGYQVMRLMLGHKSLNTTVSSYSGAETKSAQAHFDKLIRDLRGTKEIKRIRGRR
jgi:hypothetical protein